MLTKIFSIALALSATATTALAEGDARLSCHGTEPFWSLYINSQGMLLKDLSQAPVVSKRYARVEPRAAAGRMHDFVRVYETVSLTGGERATAVVRKQECSDGMSDINYTHSVVFISPSYVLEGCCVRNQ